MHFERIYLDTNIIISAFGGEADPEICLPLLDMIGAIAPSETNHFVTSELTLAEVVVRPLRLGLDETVQSYDNILTTGTWLYVKPVTRHVLYAAALLRAQYQHLKLPDAIHVATAIDMKCSHILTADKGIRDVYQIAHSETDVSTSEGNVQAIRPDSTNLNEIINWLEEM